MMDNEMREIHIHGVVQGLVIGDYNAVTLVFQSGERRRVAFLAPPQPPYQLIGRADMLGDLKEKLIAKKSLALSALRGLPGVGKTALAVALAYDPEVLSHFSDGVLWAGLGRDASEADVLSRLSLWGTALDIPPSEMEKLLDIKARQERIQAAIGQRSMLLVIDDVWEIGLAWQLKVGGPNCAYLLTTRLPEVATRYAGEGMMVVQELDEENGLRLLNRLAPLAVAAEPEEARKLVQAVGGLPLALTLMGNYLRVKSLSGQPHRLQEALDRLLQVKERLKVDEPQGELGYHPSLPTSTPLSLQAVIAVSDELLDESARQGFRAVSVFPPKPNTFSKEAALAVSLLSIKTLDILEDFGLLESSGRERYALHQTVADYAKVNCTDPRAAEQRLAEYVANFVEAHERDYVRLEQEASNVQAAFQIASQQRMDAVVLRGVNAFYPFLENRGLYVQAEDYLKLAQRAATSLGDRVGLVTVLVNLGRVMDKTGNYPQAESYSLEGLELARQVGHTERISALLQNLGLVAYDQGNYRQAENYLQEGLELARQINNTERISTLLSNLGIVAVNQGNYEQAQNYYREGLELARQVGYTERISALLSNLGRVAANRGNYQQAERYLQEGLAFARQIGHAEFLSDLLTNLGVVAVNRGNYEQAENYYQEGLELARQIGYIERISLLLANLGDVAANRGNYRQAESYSLEGLALARQIGHTEFIILLLSNLGIVTANQGNYEQAQNYYQEGLLLARQIGHTEFISTSLNHLGEVATNQGNYEQAQNYLQEGLALARQIGHTEGISLLLTNLGKVATNRGNYQQAEGYLQEGLALAHQIGHRLIIANILYQRGVLRFKKSPLNAASEDFREALERAPKENQEIIAEAQFGLAQVEASLRNSLEARQLGQTSLTLFESMGHKKASEVREWLAAQFLPGDTEEHVSNPAE
jgi:tetratricopeptide (TPR) repeat protein